MADNSQAFNETLQNAIQLHVSGDVDKAIGLYHNLLDEHPDHPDLWHLLGVAVHQKGDNRLAVQLITMALSIKNDVADYHNNLGMALRGLGQEETAEQSFRSAIRLNPQHTKALGNLASLCRHAGDIASGLDYARQAAAIAGSDPEALNNLGNAQKDAGLVGDSLTSYQRAVELDPDFALAHWNLSLALLSAGRYEEGFREISWRWRWPKFPGRRATFDQQEWAGDNLNGRTLLLYPEQGLGDMLFMLRFAPAPESNGGRIILELPKELIPLAEESHLADEIRCPMGTPSPFDVHAPLMDIPRLCELRGPDLFRTTPYIRAPSHLHLTWKNKLNHYDGLKIGLNWSGNPSSPVEQRRRLPVGQLMSLAEDTRIIWFSLQRGKPPDSPLPADFPIVDTGPASLEDTAGMISALDLVITSDTAVAHLAGALGKPVWVLLHHDPDWRWSNGETTPWYPSARLFRQTSPGDWTPVIAAVRAGLHQHIRAMRDK